MLAVDLPVKKAAQSIEVALVVIIRVMRRKIIIGGVLQKPLTCVC